uniref:SAP domain-containing protein n=1 Tax=Ascaris lumbricoides TaxID=6252 RepID=A0A0M3HSF5_ASCLU
MEHKNGQTKSLESLLKELEGKGPKPLSPDSIRKNCDRIMEYVKEYGCSTDGEETRNEKLELEARRTCPHCPASADDFVLANVPLLIEKDCEVNILIVLKTFFVCFKIFPIAFTYSA